MNTLTLSGTPEEVKQMALELFGEAKPDPRIEQWRADAAKFKFIKSKAFFHGGNTLVQVQNLFDCAENYKGDAGVTREPQIRRKNGTFEHVIVLT